MKPQAFLIVFLALLVVGSSIGIGFVVGKKTATYAPPITSYASCIASAQSVIRESYPQVCVTKDGKEFTQPVSVSPTAPTEATVDGWETYTNSTYAFSIRHPKEYKVTNDTYGWPNSVVIFYKGGQSYDVVVETWKTEDAYKKKYSDWNQMDNITVKKNGSTIITLYTASEDQTAQKIIDSFVFTESAKKDTSTYTCPIREWVDCMPVVNGPTNTQCTNEFLAWATKNCPNFKGAAY